MPRTKIPPGWRNHPALFQALKQRFRKELPEILSDLVDEIPEVERRLSHANLRDTDDRDTLLGAISEEMARLPGTPGRRGFVNDGMNFEPLLDYLRRLLAMGHADDLVELAPALLRGSCRRTELEPESESSMDLEACMELVFEALGVCSLSPSTRMVTALDLEMQDGFGLCRQGAARFWAEEFASADWSTLADELFRRLAALDTDDTTGWNYKFRRQALGKRLLDVLQRAGRESETLAVMEQQARATDDYIPLVERLLAAGERDRAMDWIRQGIAATWSRSPRAALQLRDLHRRSCIDDGNWAQVAALDAASFFAKPSLESWRCLQQSAERAGVWPAVRDTALDVLARGDQRPGSGNPGWPLPPPAVNITWPTAGIGSPARDVLIDIALADGDPVQALHWYRQHDASLTGVGEARAKRLAEALASDDLEQSVAIWLQLVALQIHEGRQGYIQVVERDLLKIRDRLVAKGWEARWQEILTELRRTYRRQRTLTTLLKKLGG